MNRRFPSLFAVAAGAVLLAGAAGAQPYPQWGDLAPGAYGVGFRVEHVYDYSRTFVPETDFAGQPMPGPIHRPLQIALWYPAGPSPSRPHLPYGAYVHLWRSELAFHAVTEAERRSAVQEFVRRTAPWTHLGSPPSPEQVATLMAAPTAAVADAPAAEGPFPLVVYPFATKMHTLVAEYLASHGYVVAGIPIVGPDPTANQRFFGGLRDVEALAGDVGFVYSHLRERPYVDAQRLAVAGPLGGAAGVRYAMETMQVDAVVAWEAAYPEALAQTPTYDPARMRAPLLSMTSRGNDPGPAFVRALAYTDRYLLRFATLEHRDTYASVERMAGALDPARTLGYDTMMRYARRFLDAYLKDDAAGLAYLRQPPAAHGLPDTLAAYEYLPAAPRRPLEAELVGLAQAGAVERMVQAYRQHRAAAPADTLFRAGVFEVLAFKLLDQGRVDDAVQVRAVIADTYPTSAAAHSNLGDALLLSGDTTRAVAAFRRALDTLPSDSGIDAEARERLRHALQQKLDAHAPHTGGG